MGKSKGPSGPQEVQQTTSNIPEFAKPFYQELMGRTMYETTRPYEAYPMQRLADFTDYETAAMGGMADMAAAGDPAEIGMASRFAQKAGQWTPGQLSSGYTSGDIASGYNAGNLSNRFQAGQRQVGYQPGQFDAGYTPGTMDMGYGARDYQSGYQAGQFDPGYQAGIRESGYQAGDIARQYSGPMFEAGTSTDPSQIQDYMNPYTQLVTDTQKREARKQSDISGSNIAQQAAQSGGLGGYREAIMQSEREGNLAQQLQDIQATGDQAAYQQAMQAMEADRAARLQEAQFGTQVRGQDIQAFQAGEGALQSQEQMQQQAFQAGEQARQEAARMGLSAQQQEEAARQAQESARLAGSQFQESTQARLQDFKNQKFQAEEQARQEASRLGLSAQEMEDRARQAGEQFQQAQFGQNEELRMAQQQEDRAVFDAQERARQEGARLGLNAQEIQERVNQAENQARMAAQEFNIGTSERAARMGLDAAQFLGGLGGQRQDMAYNRLQNLQAAGQIQRELGQRGLDIGYQDFLRQQAFPREQLAMLSAMLQGLPIQPGTTTSSFGTGPSDMQQMLGTGIGGVGLYNAMRGR